MNFLSSIEQKYDHKGAQKYKALKVQLENLKEREAAEMNNLFPQLRLALFNELKVCDRQIEQSLGGGELKIIKAKFSPPNK